MAPLTAPSPTYILDAGPQLMWANILVICASLLLALFLLTLAMGWWRHFSRLVWLSLLLDLAVISASTVAALHLYDTYASWAAFFNSVQHGRHLGPYLSIVNELTSDNQMAAMLGWAGVIVTGVLVAVGLLGIGRLVGPAHRRHPRASLASES
jgi:hypothetical protein